MAQWRSAFIWRARNAFCGSHHAKDQGWIRAERQGRTPCRHKSMDRNQALGEYFRICSPQKTTTASSNISSFDLTLITKHPAWALARMWRSSELRLIWYWPHGRLNTFPSRRIEVPGVMKPGGAKITRIDSIRRSKLNRAANVFSKERMNHQNS